MATSYSQGDKFYIDPAKLLPLEKFLPQPKYAFLTSLLDYINMFDMIRSICFFFINLVISHVPSMNNLLHFLNSFSLEGVNVKRWVRDEDYAFFCDFQLDTLYISSIILL